MSTHTLTDVPDGDVDEVVTDFESESCTVNKQKQPDGTWTVVATCPDEED